MRLIVTSYSLGELRSPSSHSPVTTLNALCSCRPSPPRIYIVVDSCVHDTRCNSISYSLKGKTSINIKVCARMSCAASPHCITIHVMMYIGCTASAIHIVHVACSLHESRMVFRMSKKERKNRAQSIYYERPSCTESFKTIHYNANHVSI